MPPSPCPADCADWCMTLTVNEVVYVWEEGVGPLGLGLCERKEVGSDSV